MNKKLIAQLAMAAAMLGDYDAFYAPRTKVKFSDKPIRAIDSRQLREFSIKGHKVMAYSRKDAITRLKHQKKI